jgi:hypothetical protein
MILKSQVHTNGTPCPQLSPSVFLPTPGLLKQYKYPIIDTALLKCTVPTCKALGTKKPCVFHYTCWRHAMSLKATLDLSIIELENKDDRILCYFDVNEDDRKFISSKVDHLSKVIFPICGKACINKVKALRNLDEAKALNEQTNGIIN